MKQKSETNYVSTLCHKIMFSKLQKWQQKTMLCRPFPQRTFQHRIIFFPYEFHVKFQYIPCRIFMIFDDVSSSSCHDFTKFSIVIFFTCTFELFTFVSRVLSVSELLWRQSFAKTQNPRWLGGIVRVRTQRHAGTMGTNCALFERTKLFIRTRFCTKV